MLHTKTDHPLVRLQLLRQDIGFHLIDGRNDLVVTDQVNEPVGVEVRDSYRADESIFIHRLQVSPCCIDIAIRPMQKHQVEVVRTELLHGFHKRSPGAGKIAVHHLGSDEHILTRHAGFSYPLSDKFLIVI